MSDAICGGSRRWSCAPSSSATATSGTRERSLHCSTRRSRRSRSSHTPTLTDVRCGRSLAIKPDLADLDLFASRAAPEAVDGTKWCVLKLSSLMRELATDGRRVPTGSATFPYAPVSASNLENSFLCCHSTDSTTRIARSLPCSRPRRRRRRAGLSWATRHRGTRRRRVLQVRLYGSFAHPLHVGSVAIFTCSMS